MSSHSDVLALLTQNGQAHLLGFWESLGEESRRDLLEQLRALRFDELNALYRQATAPDAGTLPDDAMTSVAPAFREGQSECSEERLAEHRTKGLREISLGHVAVVLLAGGQGTRLGVSHPKGMFSVGLPSGKTLLQLQAERLLRVQELARKQEGSCKGIPWYIMTSEATNFETERFLRENGFFGIEEGDVKIFEQNMLPCFDFDGKIILEGVGCVAKAPDGNGGFFKVALTEGVFADMKARGVRYLQVYGVDNILVKVADPVFIGYCVGSGAQCGNKVIKKIQPTEALGVTCVVDGKFKVVEYSEISSETANLRDEKGDLKYNAGNICQHFFTLDYLLDFSLNHEHKMRLHVAKKNIPCVDENGTSVRPTKPNGIKIEKFVFDVFEFCKRLVLWEVKREEEFSALKNSEDAGTECPSTAKSALLTLHKKYIEDAGGIVEGNEVEISPLVSYAGEGLENVKGRRFVSPFILNPSDEGKNSS